MKATIFAWLTSLFLKMEAPSAESHPIWPANLTKLATDSYEFGHRFSLIWPVANFGEFTEILPNLAA